MPRVCPSPVPLRFTHPGYTVPALRWDGTRTPIRRSRGKGCIRKVGLGFTHGPVEPGTLVSWSRVSFPESGGPESLDLGPRKLGQTL